MLIVLLYQAGQKLENTYQESTRSQTPTQRFMHILLPKRTERTLGIKLKHLWTKCTCRVRMVKPSKNWSQQSRTIKHRR